MTDRMDPDEWRRSKIRSEWACDLCGEHMLNDRCGHGIPCPRVTADGRIEWVRSGA